MKIKRFMTLETSYEEGLAEVGIRSFLFHVIIITKLTDNIMAVVCRRKGDIRFALNWDILSDIISQICMISINENG